MDSGAPMVLPKGIVINTTNIYKEVASYPTVPADKVWEYWHVYTTTNKRLRDPTARRLENFWWHVWGSDRRFLSGRALARLYEHISVGPTIAPLQGPPNRWEGPNAPPLTRQLILAHLSRGRDAQQQRASPPLTRPGDASVKSLSSSASKPPPSHPILKKSRGPSSSGPRPTARFVSPHESADESDEANGPPSAKSTPTAAPETSSSSTTTTPKKKPSATTKKFVATSAVARKRPVVHRKTSPQSPILSAAASRQGDLPNGSRAAGLLRPVSPIPERISNHVAHDPEDVDEVGSQKLPGPSAKTLGKRPAAVAVVAERVGLVDGPSLSSAPRTGQTATAQGHARPPQLQSLASRASHRRTPSAATSSSALGSPTTLAPPTMIRSQSHNGYGLEYGSYSDARARAPNSSRGLFTGATASTTNVAAQGTIIDQAGSLPAPSMVGSPLVGETLLSGKPAASSLLEPRLTPTQPGPSASVPMGRTRSQLTLLLEREKARTGDKPRSKS